MIEIRTFPAPAVLRDGVPLDALDAQRQKLALLVYVALEGPVSRERLVSIFWPDKPEDRARHSLNQALYALRRELGEEHFGGNGDAVALGPDVRVDAREVERAAREERWEDVVSLYGGAFLDRFSFPDSTPFDQWQTATRARFARHARRAFTQAVAKRVAAGRLQEALGLAGRWADLEPLEDEAQHALIGLLALTGDRTGALREFESYRERLRRELEVEPLEQTIALVERLRAGDLSEFELLGTKVAPPRGADTSPPARVREPAATYAPSGPAASGAAAPGSPTAPGHPGEPGRSTEPGRTADREPARPALPEHRAREPQTPQPFSLHKLGVELRARPVFQITALYLAVGWVAIQLVDLLIDRELLPGWTFGGLLFALALGLPAVLLVGWAHEQATRGDAAGRIRLGPRRSLIGLGTLVLAILGAQTLAESQRMAAASAQALESGLDPSRIAVLYFDDYSPDQSLEHIVGGFTDALIHELSQVDALDVVARNSVKRFRDSDLPLDSIARELGVGTLVEGSLTRSGDVLRVTVQLIDGASVTHLLSETIDRPISEILELESDLTHEVSGMLRKRLGQEIRLREQRVGASDAGAWQLVQRAQFMIDDYDALWRPDSAATHAILLRVDSLLARAEELDPEWIGPSIARARNTMRLARLDADLPGQYEEGWTQVGLRHVERALEIDPRNAQALELRGVLRFELAELGSGAEARKLYASAEEDLRAAVQADPLRARAWATLAELLRTQNRLAPAKRAAERAHQADAFLAEAATVVHILYHTSLELQQFPDAQRWCVEGRESFPDDARFQLCGLFMLVSSPLVRPNVDSAWAYADRYVELTGESSRLIYRAYVDMQVAKVLVLAGMLDSAEVVAQQARETGARAGRQGLIGPDFLAYDEAHYRLLRGEEERSLRLLAEHLRNQPNRRTYIQGDWWFRALRNNPGFVALTADPG